MAGSPSTAYAPGMKARLALFLLRHKKTLLPAAIVLLALLIWLAMPR